MPSRGMAHVGQQRWNNAMFGGSIDTKAWRVLMFRLEHAIQLWKIALNILNKHSRTVDKGLSSSLGTGRGIWPQSF
jgi:hypothetical protein